MENLPKSSEPKASGGPEGLNKAAYFSEKHNLSGKVWTVSLTLLAIGALERISGMQNISPKDEFKVVGIDKDAVTLAQGEAQFTVRDMVIVDEVKRKILSQSPELRTFIESLDKKGVKVINTETEKESSE